MKSIQQEIRVDYRYAVHFTTDFRALVREIVGDAKVLFVIDSAVSIEVDGPSIVVPGGEDSKNDPRHLETIQEAIQEAGLCRHSYVVAVGGGAVLDVAGYAAAIAHRGIRLIRVPTTVLAQDDSGVGVKNGVNAFGKKNYLGTFAPPYAVINDFNFLRTLSDRDWRSGLAEAVKVALIKDAKFFDFLEAKAAALATRDMPAMMQTVERCAELHLGHIANSGDPFELGTSRPLDFGHWSAHKLEQLTDFELRHGEAVAIGIALDSTYSWLSGHLAEKDWRRIVDLLFALGFAVYTPEMRESLFAGLDEFREHLGGELTIMLLRSIGVGFEVHEIDRDLMSRGIEILEERSHVPVGRKRIS